MNVLLIGHGRMGQLLEREIEAADDMELIGVVHPGLYETPAEVPGRADIAIDFSYPGNLEKTLDYGLTTGCAVLIGTTALSDAQEKMIAQAAEKIPVMYCANYSLGVAVLKRAAAMTAQMLGETFDMEIVETHHNQKADAPSGTAKALLQAIDPQGEYTHVFGRSGITGKRGREIGVHALRGGTAAGTHTVAFFGRNETLELTHRADNREIFVTGALRAAHFVCGREKGLYTMDDVLNG